MSTWKLGWGGGEGGDNGHDRWCLVTDVHFICLKVNGAFSLPCILGLMLATGLCWMAVGCCVPWT